MKKDMPLEGLRWSRDSGSALYDTPPNGRSRTGWGAIFRRNNLLIKKEIDTQPPTAQGKLITLCNEL